MGKATQELRNEHENISELLRLTSKLISVNYLDSESKLKIYDGIRSFLKEYADALHHGKEENILFKELEKRGVPVEGGPIGVMLHEHTLGRGLIGRMGSAIEKKNTEEFEKAATEYINLLSNHINKENNILFMMADRVISEKEQDEIHERFISRENEVMSSDKKEGYLSFLKSLSETL